MVGRPALVMAVDRYMHAEIVPTRENSLEVALPDALGNGRISTTALPALRSQLEEKHDRFLAGELNIRDLLDQPVQLVYFAVAYLLDQLQRSLDGGLRVTLTSELPIGSGMGASAAVSAAVLHGTAALLGEHPDVDTLCRWTSAVERLQHGRSSGVDPFVVTHGGFMRFQQGRAEMLPVPRRPVTLVLTGKPASSTGECVAHVARHVPAADPIWAQFEQITAQLQTALEEDDESAVQACVRANHRLLCRIGVVPATVHAFIAAVEEQGGAAKICGAGAVQGESGGVVAVFGGGALDDVCAAHGYTLSQVNADTHGCRRISLMASGHR